MDGGDKTKYGIGCCACIAFIVILLFALSWGSVEPTEWGLKYNSITKNIDNTTSKYFIRNAQINPFFNFFPTQSTMAEGT